jgi:hypothetical protein
MFTPLFIVVEPGCADITASGRSGQPVLPHAGLRFA